MLQVNDYVIVTKQPEQWEGDSSTPEDWAAFVGHVGIVIENTFPAEEGMTASWLVGFFRYNLDTYKMECNHLSINEDALKLVSTPAKPLSEWFWEN